MTRMPCIYCGQIDVPRNEEHVLQKHFGTEARLRHEVCEGCNSAFSPIDKHFIEAVQFFHTGKRVARLLGLGAVRSKEGPTLVARRRKDGLGAFLSQLVEIDGSQWRFVGANRADGADRADLERMLQELSDPQNLTIRSNLVSPAEGWPRLAIIRSGLRTYLVQGSDADLVRRFCEMLGKVGFKPNSIGERGSISVHHGEPIEFRRPLRLDLFSRAMAKIALNFTCYRLGAETVLRPEFDGVRRFARYGTGHWFDWVCPTLLNHDLEGVGAPFFSSEDHGIILLKTARDHGGKAGVFVVIEGKAVGRVSLDQGRDVLPDGTWLLTRFTPMRHSCEDYMLPNDLPRAVINPVELGMQDVWPECWA